MRPLCKHQVQAEWTEVDTQARNQVAVVNRDVNETFSFETETIFETSHTAHSVRLMASKFKLL